MKLGDPSVQFNTKTIMLRSHTNLGTGNKSCHEIRLEIIFHTVRINEEINKVFLSPVYSQ